MVRFISLCSIYLLWSCATTEIIQKPESEYYQDMYLNVDDEYEGKGFLVIPEKKEIDIEAKWFYRADQITATNCDGEEIYKTFEGWFRRGEKKIDIENFKLSSLAKSSHCPLWISAYDYKGKHSFGTIYFKAPEENIPVVLWCNRRKTNDIGVSVCQTRTGSSIQLTFEKDLNWSGEENCPKLRKINPGVFEYVSKTGECIYTFGSKGGDKFHRHISFGYNKHSLRSE